MITEIEDYFTKGCDRCARFNTPQCSARIWSQGQDELRRILRATGMTETVKWAHPTYMHAGRNIAIMGAFQGDFRLTFFNAALMKDPEGILEPQGPNSRTPGMIRFTDQDGPKRLEPVISAYLREAMGYAEAGILPPRDDRPLELPDELVEALDSDPELAEGYFALTPGRQKSYIININGAKAAATRFARIERFRGKILAGKGALER